MPFAHELFLCNNGAELFLEWRCGEWQRLPLYCEKTAAVSRRFNALCCIVICLKNGTIWASQKLTKNHGFSRVFDAITRPILSRLVPHLEIRKKLVRMSAVPLILLNYCLFNGWFCRDLAGRDAKRQVQLITN